MEPFWNDLPEVAAINRGPFFEVWGDPYNWETGKQDMGVRYHVNKYGVRQEAKYRG